MALGRFDIYLIVNEAGDKLMADNIDCCCGGNACTPPTAWAIVDYTNGFNILLTGNCLPNQPRPPEGAETGGLLLGFPNQPWRTRAYSSTLTPIKMGVFMYCPGGQGIWMSVDTWEVPVNHCCAGAWWDEHQFPASFTDPCCGESWVSDGAAAPFGEYFATTFHGSIDAEWTNMRNWSSPETSNYWEMKLPDETVDVTISVTTVLSDAGCDAKAKNLTVDASRIGIKIVAAEDITMSGGLLLGADGNTFCLGTAGELEAGRDIGFTGSTSMSKCTAGRDIVFADQSLNDGDAEMTAGRYAKFERNSQNRGEVTAAGGEDGNIIFMSASWNECGTLWSDAVFMDDSHNSGDCFLSSIHYFHGTVLFRDSSRNETSIGMDNFNSLTFTDGAENTSLGYISAGDGDTVLFNGESKNSGTITAEDGESPVVSFEESAVNAASGLVYCDVTFRGSAKNYGTLSVGLSQFRDNSENFGSLSSEAEFYDNALNKGTALGETTFYGSSQNAVDGVCSGQTEFYGSSQNHGRFTTAYFYDSSSNQMANSGPAGPIIETGYFYGTSTNAGNVWYGNFYDNATNPGSVGEVTLSNSGVAVFNGNSTHTGIVYGMATFNDSSNNLGTVTGNVFCNTTGIC